MRGCLRKEETMSEENKALIRRLYEEVWNQHNPEAADMFVAQDVFNRDMVAEHQHGIDGQALGQVVAHLLSGPPFRHRGDDRRRG